jgi:hypothetical protein
MRLGFMQAAQIVAHHQQRDSLDPTITGSNSDGKRHHESKASPEFHLSELSDQILSWLKANHNSFPTRIAQLVSVGNTLVHRNATEMAEPYGLG